MIPHIVVTRLVTASGPIQKRTLLASSTNSPPFLRILNAYFTVISLLLYTFIVCLRSLSIPVLFFIL